MKSVREVPGKRSPVRFQSGQPMQFVVRLPVAFPQVEPASRFRLYKLQTSKNKRQLVIARGYFTPVRSSTVRDQSRDAVTMEFSPSRSVFHKDGGPSAARG